MRELKRRKMSQRCRWGMVMGDRGKRRRYIRCRGVAEGRREGRVIISVQYGGGGRRKEGRERSGTRVNVKRMCKEENLRGTRERQDHLKMVNQTLGIICNITNRTPLSTTHNPPGTDAAAATPSTNTNAE